MSETLKGWELLHSKLPSAALKPLPESAYGIKGLTDVNEAYLIQRLFASGLKWEWRITNQAYLGHEDRKPRDKDYTTRWYLASVSGELVIDERRFGGSGAHDNHKLDAAFKGAATVAFKNAAKIAGLTIELFKDGRAMDHIYASDDQGAGTTPPLPPASSSAQSPAPPSSSTTKTPEEILAATKARLSKPLPTDNDNGYDLADAVCPSCGKKEFLRPAGNPRFCAKNDGGCGFPNSKRGETFSLISRGEWLERHP